MYVKNISISKFIIHLYFWQHVSAGGVPFIILGNQPYQCHQGKDDNFAKKEKYKQKNRNNKKSLRGLESLRRPHSSTTKYFQKMTTFPGLNFLSGR